MIHFKMLHWSLGGEERVVVIFDQYFLNGFSVTVSMFLYILRLCAKAHLIAF